MYVQQQPIKVYMKQKIFSWGNKFSISNERNEDIMYVKGEVLSIGKKLHILDKSNQEVAFIQQKTSSLLTQYDVDVRVPAPYSFSVQQSFAGLGIHFNIMGSLNWKLKGDFMDHNYTLHDITTTAQKMHLTKKWLSWGDSYELYINNPNDLIPCLCVALAVDAFLEARR